MLLPELKQLAGTLGIKGAGALRKGQLIEAIKAAQGGGASGGAGTGAAAVSQGSNGTAVPATQPTLVDAGDQPAARGANAPRIEARGDDVQTETRPDSPDSTESRPNRERGESQGNREDRGENHRERGDNQGQRDRGGENRGGENRGGDNRGGDNRGENQQNRDRNENRGGESQGNRDNQGNRGGDNRGGDNRGGGEDGDGRRRRRRGRDRGRDSGGRDSGRDGGRDGGRGGRTGGRDRFDVEPVVTEDDVLVPAAGILDVLDNYAFVRTGGYLPGPNDVYVSLAMVKRYGLRKGDAITGAVRQPREGERKEKFNPLVRIDTVNGSDPDAAKHRPEFQKLVPLYATERLRLETEPQVLTTRIIDIMAPIGKGNRGLIVSPAKAGKTMILQSIANAITTNNPEVHLMVVLVDERPEEVTDMQRTVKGEVIASTFDRPADDHTTVAELAIERAKRLVELGHDVVVMLDSITRLGRAYNLAAPASGRILSGGVDSSALYPPKRFFGAARNIEDGGSLTILATALIETGSKMDEVIFEEFKGTGNMELRLRREYADKRIFPAIDVDASSTRREELLMSKDELAVTWKLRRVLSALDGQSALELMINKLKDTKSNIEFLLQVNKTTPSAGGRRTDDGD
jgi:transcription termination factor Rho